MSGINASAIRELIDRHLSLQWCRENIVTPLKIMNTRDTDGECVLVAIGNFSYLATIGDFIKLKFADAGLSCHFTEKPHGEIQRILDDASNQRLMPKDNIDSSISDDSILDSLKDADDAESAEEFDYEFDDSDEEIIEENAIDLSNEMQGSKIQ